MVRLAGKDKEDKVTECCGRGSRAGQRRVQGDRAPMNDQAQGDLVHVLGRIVGEAKDLQKSGRLQDPVSCSEVSLLEHELAVMQARLAATAIPDVAGGRAAAVADWARALQGASAAARDHSRRLRKDLYRTRMISGSASP